MFARTDRTIGSISGLRHNLREAREYIHVIVEQEILYGDSVSNTRDAQHIRDQIEDLLALTERHNPVEGPEPRRSRQ